MINEFVVAMDKLREREATKVTIYVLDKTNNFAFFYKQIRLLLNNCYPRRRSRHLHRGRGGRT